MRNLFWYFFRGSSGRGNQGCREGETGVILFIVCDGGWKYLSTGAWSGDIDNVANSIESIIYF
ncbi:MAG: hypothetical protein Ct9H90mP5_10020 [Acidimicrobiaceae bacterium]|nr:MAG: hypothetical protein Ct9H90mP5_10020 [Acidimicrobiaceae bacterium]